MFNTGGNGVELADCRSSADAVSDLRVSDHNRELDIDIGTFIEAMQVPQDHSDLRQLEGCQKASKTGINEYFFNDDGTMCTGWYNNDMSFDRQGVRRCFGKSGLSPMTSRLGRMCRCGQLCARRATPSMPSPKNNKLSRRVFAPRQLMIMQTLQSR